MILDKLENASLYASISPCIYRALAILKDPESIHQPDGKYIVEEDRIWYMVQRYETKSADSCKLESHDRFTDIHFIVSGEEVIGYSPRDVLQTSVPYSAERDVTYYVSTPLGEMNPLRLSGGCFAIFFPQDAHIPGVRNDRIERVHKIVFKIPSGC